MAWTTIHLRAHDHLIVKGTCKEVINQVKALVHEKVSWTLLITSSTIALTTSKMNLSQHLFNKDGKGSTKPLKGEKLHQMMDKFSTQCSPNVWNLVASFKHHLSNRGYFLTFWLSRPIMVMITLKINNILERKFSCSRCLWMETIVDVN